MGGVLRVVLLYIACVQVGVLCDGRSRNYQSARAGQDQYRDRRKYEGLNEKYRPPANYGKEPDTRQSFNRRSNEIHNRLSALPHPNYGQQRGNKYTNERPRNSHARYEGGKLYEKPYGGHSDNEHETGYGGRDKFHSTDEDEDNNFDSFITDEERGKVPRPVRLPPRDGNTTPAHRRINQAPHQDFRFKRPRDSRNARGEKDPQYNNNAHDYRFRNERAPNRGYEPAERLAVGKDHPHRNRDTDYPIPPLKVEKDSYDRGYQPDKRYTGRQDPHRGPAHGEREYIGRVHGNVDQYKDNREEGYRGNDNDYRLRGPDHGAPEKPFRFDSYNSNGGHPRGTRKVFKDRVSGRTATHTDAHRPYPHQYGKNRDNRDEDPHRQREEGYAPEPPRYEHQDSGRKSETGPSYGRVHTHISRPDNEYVGSYPRREGPEEYRDRSRYHEGSPKTNRHEQREYKDVHRPHVNTGNAIHRRPPSRKPVAYNIDENRHSGSRERDSYNNINQHRPHNTYIRNRPDPRNRREREGERRGHSGVYHTKDVRHGPRDVRHGPRDVRVGPRRPETYRRQKPVPKRYKRNDSLRYDTRNVKEQTACNKTKENEVSKNKPFSSARRRYHRIVGRQG